MHLQLFDPCYNLSSLCYKHKAIGHWIKDRPLDILRNKTTNLTNFTACCFTHLPRDPSWHTVITSRQTVSLREQTAIISRHIFYFITHLTVSQFLNMQFKCPPSPSDLPRTRNNCGKFLAHKLCIVKAFSGSCDEVIAILHHWISFNTVSAPNHTYHAI